MSTATTTDTLRPVIRLLYLNLAISVVLAVLTFAFQHNVLDYQVARLAGGNPAARQGLADVLWIRPASVLLIGIIYLRLANRLRLGRRRTYVRVLLIGALGCAGAIYLVISAQFPVWMRVGQIAQAVVLLALLFAVTRRDVRAHFSGQAGIRATTA
jgi:hypothetical protein